MNVKNHNIFWTLFLFYPNTLRKNERVWSDWTSAHNKWSDRSRWGEGRGVGLYFAIVWLMPTFGSIQNNAHEGIIFFVQNQLKRQVVRHHQNTIFIHLKYSYVLLVMNLEEETYETYHRLLQFSCKGNYNVLESGSFVLSMQIEKKRRTLCTWDLLKVGIWLFHQLRFGCPAHIGSQTIVQRQC